MNLVQNLENLLLLIKLKLLLHNANITDKHIDHLLLNALHSLPLDVDLLGLVVDDDRSHVLERHQNPLVACRKTTNKIATKIPLFMGSIVQPNSTVPNKVLNDGKLFTSHQLMVVQHKITFQHILTHKDPDPPAQRPVRQKIHCEADQT
jgi:hypothetical protein